MVYASFDLHVLGTPPAFILSQDQTLVKSFSRIQNDVSHSSSDTSSCVLLFF